VAKEIQKDTIIIHLPYKEIDHCQAEAALLPQLVLLVAKLQQATTVPSFSTMASIFTYI
jgi:hypothetical protein